MPQISIQNFINGKIVAGNNSRSSNVFNPATGKVTAQVQFSTPQDLDQAVNIAHQAFLKWQQVTPLRRSRIIAKFKDLIEQNIEELARLISKEHGKVHSDAVSEVNRGLEVVEFAVGIPQLLKGQYSQQTGSGVDVHTLNQALGVVAGITPFNFPAMVPMWMFPVAIACGNSFILKPSEKDPSASLFLASLFTQAGLPDGVFNVVQGDKEIVDAILEHPLVKAVSFVGSTPIAQYIYSQGSKYGKRVQALGGAKNHALIMPDADIDATVNAMLGAAFGAAGERCMALSVAVTVNDQYADDLIANMIPKIKALKVGPGYLDNPAPDHVENDMGPVISKEHRQKILDYIDSGVAQGAKLVIDGRDFKQSGEYSDGYYLGPTLFDNVLPEHKIYQEEIFGPVFSVLRAQSFSQALELINSHQFGNGAVIFTNQGHYAQRFTDQVQAGMVGVNIPIPVPVAYHSFGGWKDSIFGALNAYGEDGIRFYTKMKTITTRWPDQNSKADNKVHYSMPNS